MAEMISRLIDLVPDEVRHVAPLAGPMMAAIKRIRVARFREFFLTLDREIAAQGDGARRRLEAEIESDAGAEFLHDYAESVVRTGSQTAIAALAVLYGDTECKYYTAPFKVAACQGLAGASEPLMSFFLALIESAGRQGAALVSSTEIHFSIEDLSAQSEAVQRIGRTSEERLALLDELIRRGWLLRDIGLRYGGGEAAFCIAPDTEVYARLLRRARSVRSPAAPDAA